MTKLMVCVPVPEARFGPVSALAPRGMQSRPRLTLLDNGKPRGRELLELVAAELQSRWELDAAVRTRSKPSAGRPISDEDVIDLLAEADVVIAGVGDCGACSTSTVCDAAKLERAGMPTAVIITDAFEGLIETYAGSLGVPDLRPVVAPHPVVSLSDSHLRELAAVIAVEVADRLALVSTRAPLMRSAS